MATKKTPTSKIESGVIKVAGALGTIAGTVAVKKDQFVKKAAEVIETAKAKWQRISGAKKKAAKKVKKGAKKTAKKVKAVAKKATKKVARKASAAKKTAKTAVGKATS